MNIEIIVASIYIFSSVFNYLVAKGSIYPFVSLIGSILSALVIWTWVLGK